MKGVDGPRYFHNINVQTPSSTNTKPVFNIAEELLSFEFPIPSKSSVICTECKIMLEEHHTLRMKLGELNKRVFYLSNGILDEMEYDDNETNDYPTDEDYSEGINNVNMHDYCNHSEEPPHKKLATNKTWEGARNMILNPHLFKPPDNGDDDNDDVDNDDVNVNDDTEIPIETIPIQNNNTDSQQIHFSPASIVNSVSTKPPSQLDNQDSLNSQQQQQTHIEATTLQHNDMEFVKLRSSSITYQPIVKTLTDKYFPNRDACCQTKESGEHKFPWSDEDTPGTNAYIFVKWPSSLKYKKCSKETAPIVISILRGLYWLNRADFQGFCWSLQKTPVTSFFAWNATLSLLFLTCRHFRYFFSFFTQGNNLTVLKLNIKVKIKVLSKPV